jgi:hypothetical protein
MVLVESRLLSPPIQSFSGYISRESLDLLSKKLPIKMYGQIIVELCFLTAPVQFSYFAFVMKDSVLRSIRLMQLRLRKLPRTFGIYVTEVARSSYQLEVLRSSMV